MENNLKLVVGSLWMKHITKLGFLFMLGVTMNACSSSENWKEEVQLSDGRIIVVERERLGESGGDEWASNRSGSKPKEYRIRFIYLCSYRNHLTPAVSGGY